MYLHSPSSIYQPSTSIFTQRLFFFFFRSFFSMWTIYKVFIEFRYTIASVLCFGILTVRHVGLYSQNRDQTHTPCLEGGSPHHWATKEVPVPHFRSSDFVQNLFSSHNVKMDAWAPKLPSVLPCWRGPASCQALSLVPSPFWVKIESSKQTRSRNEHCVWSTTKALVDLTC